MLLNKKFMLIAIFLVSLLAISAVSASDNSTSDIVCADDNIVDDVLSDSDDGTFSALKNKIDAAGEGSTISLENDYAYEGDSDNPISISKQLTIDGKGHTIDGNSKTSVFRLNAGVTLKNIIFTHCMGRYGGTISISASDCNIDSCNFIDCNGLSEYGFPKKDNWGAGIYNLGANCNIDSCNFVNCTTYNGGAIYTSALNSKITSCSFTNCHAGNQGGAISNDLECTIASCNFTQCSADFQGEAIFNALESGYSNVCNINECNFINCTSEYNTKTIFNNKGNAKATKCRFIDIDKSDATKDVTLVDCIFKKAGEPDPVPVVLTDDDFNFTFITNEVKDNDDAAIISLFIPNGVDESNGVIRVKYGEGAYDYENFNIGSNNVNKLLTIYFDDLYIYNPEGSYNLNIAYYVGDDFKLELGNGTLNVIKTYSADDFISSFYDRVVDEADEDVGYVRDSTGSNLDGVVTVFANNTQVYRKEFNGTVLGQSIDCGDLIGSFNGVYNMKITYNKSGIEYSKEATFNFVISVVNKELTPEDFKVTFLASEVDLENSNQAIISYYCPEGMKGYSPQIIVRYGNGSFDRQIYDIKSNEINTYKNITWSSLYQWDTGVYNLSVWYGDYFEPILKLGEISIKVVDNYVPVDEDFMELYPKVISDPEDYVCVMCDPTETGLNGVVTIYANGTQVYSQKLIRAQNSGIQIRAKNLTGNLNGEYKIKVVYNKADGKQYSLEEMITFRNIINADPVKTTISASALSIAYGANKNLVATLKDAQGKPIESVDVIINIMGVKYPLKTDKNGQIKQSVSSLPPKTHTITLTFNGNANYAKSTKSVKVTVKKATPTITAAKKTYKVSEKTKKYTITLKVNGKVMKSTKVSLTVNKKTFSANTNSKGQATFKINNLKKKGTFSATINYKATNYYNKATKTVKITAK